VLLIVGSVVSHTSKAVFSQIGKTLGYFYEVNWSVNYVVAIPIALYFCASAMNAIRHVIAELAKSNMIVGANGQPRDRVRRNCPRGGLELEAQDVASETATVEITTPACKLITATFDLKALR
jgi:hypothetical protein